MEAGLLELFFDVDAAAFDEGEEISAEPGDFREGHPALGDVDGLTGEVGGGGVALSRCGVAVDMEEVVLELDGADGGVDLERCMEAGVVGLRHGGEELGDPGAAEAAVGGEAVVDAEGDAFGDGDELAGAAFVEQVDVVEDAVEAVAVGHEVLVDEDFVRAEERGDDAAAGAVGGQLWEDEGVGGGFGNGLELGVVGGAANDADDADGLGGLAGWGLRGGLVGAAVGRGGVEEIAGGGGAAGCGGLRNLARIGEMATVSAAGGVAAREAGVLGVGLGVAVAATGWAQVAAGPGGAG